MDKFIHKSVRLSCDINRAMRMFLIESNAEKWLGNVAIENKVGGNFLFDLQIGDEILSLKQSKIIAKEFEKLIRINMCMPEVIKGAFVEGDSILELNFMQGASRTEYCTEIHLIQKNFKSESGEEIRHGFEVFWTNKLEQLRELINGDWVIEDRDLNRSILMGARL